MPHGAEGKYVFDDGSVYMGPMENGRMHGLGEFHDKNDNTVHKGMFENGKKEGRGVNIQEDKVSQFMGEWEDDKLAYHVGVLIKNMDTGEYSLRNQEGRQTYPGGGVYTGQFLNGKRHGQGKY